MKKTLRERRRDATREELLDAAEAIMLKNGFENVTMRDISSEAGCSSATLYQYFTDKRELLAEIFGRHFDSLIRTVHERLAAMENPMDPVSRLKTIGRCMMQHMMGHRALVEVFKVHLPPSRTGPMEHLPRGFRAQFLEFDKGIVKTIKAAQRSRLIRRDVSAETLKLFFARHMGNACELLNPEQKSGVSERDCQIAWSLLLNGIGIV
jgi:AcrR family transcriptional regulator